MKSIKHQHRRQEGQDLWISAGIRQKSKLSEELGKIKSSLGMRRYNKANLLTWKTALKFLHLC